MKPLNCSRSDWLTYYTFVFEIFWKHQTLSNCSGLCKTFRLVGLKAQIGFCQLWPRTDEFQKAWNTHIHSWLILMLLWHIFFYVYFFVGLGEWIYSHPHSPQKRSNIWFVMESIIMIIVKVLSKGTLLNISNVQLDSRKVKWISLHLT